MYVGILRYVKYSVYSTSIELPIDMAVCMLPCNPLVCVRSRVPLLWAPAQRKRATMLLCQCYFLFIYFFMAALFSGPG